MKPLVYYCRWKGAKLRLRGRDNKYIYGQLVFSTADGGETVQDFHYELAIAELTLINDAGEQAIILDEMGIPQHNEK